MRELGAPWSRRHSVSWAEFRDFQLSPVAGAVGEIRSPGNLDELPAGRSLRAVCIEDESGFVVRWADCDRLLDAGVTVFHDDLYRGESLGFVSEGYIVWSPGSGTLEVSP